MARLGGFGAAGKNKKTDRAQGGSGTEKTGKRDLPSSRRLIGPPARVYSPRASADNFGPDN